MAIRHFKLIAMLVFFPVSAITNQVIASSVLTQGQSTTTQAQAIQHFDTVQDILIYIDPPRGGFGDVASNIMMIEKLQEERPTARIKVFVDKDAEQLLATILPNYQIGVSHQKIRIGKYEFDMSSRYNTQPDHVAFALTFSTDGGHLESMKPFSNYQIGYQEYSDIDWQEGATWYRKGEAVHSITSANGSGSVMMNTGGLSHGYYISASGPPPMAISRTELKRTLEQITGTSIPKSFSIDQGALLAYAYSKRKLATEIYLDGLALSARKPPWKDRQILCVIKHHDGIKIPRLPPNVHLLQYKTTPYEISKALIAHSDLPILITGDGSLSQALDYEKVAFYESNSWKNESSLSLIEELAQSSHYLSEPRQKSRLGRALTIEPIVGDVQPREISKLIGDRRFQSEFRAAIAQMRGRTALAQHIWQQLDIIQQITPARLNKTVLSPIIQALMMTKDATKALSYLQNSIKNNNLPRNERLQAVTALLGLKNWNTPETRQAIFSLLEDQSPAMRGSGRDYFLDGLSRDPGRFEPLFEAAFSEGSPKAREGLLRILTSAAAIVEQTEDPRTDHTALARSFLNKHKDLILQNSKTRKCDLSSVLKSIISQ